MVLLKLPSSSSNLASRTVAEIADELDIYPRAASTSSDPCKHSNSNLCEKPVSNNALTIALAVVIPCIVIILVLILLLYRNYRKDKKEEMEHDPDFDENGEATALPDLPTHKYEMEDPFHNRNSVRYPQPGGAGFYGNQHANRSASSIAPSTSDPYLEQFVLPYHHQTSSKASLDDYARFFGDNPGYDLQSRSSQYLTRTRDSSISQTPPPIGSNTSPHKSHLRTELSNRNLMNTNSQRSPVKKVGTGNLAYTNIPNESTTSVTTANTQFKSAISDLESVSNSEDEGEMTTSAVALNNGGEKFGLSYENESDVKLNSGIRELHPEPNVDAKAFAAKTSPFEIDAGSTANTTVGTYTEPKYDSDDDDTEPVEGDFDFSGENVTQDNSQTHLNPNGSMPITKSPRMSAFNLLKNDSDEEDLGESGQALDDEQKEELKRMKSVYRVYFEGKEENGSEGQVAEKAFQPDLKNPLPRLETNFDAEPEAVRINKDLKMDTNYDKRMTTTSSIYTEAFNNEEQGQHYYQQHGHPQQQQQLQPQYQQQYQPEYYQQEQYAQPEAQLAPLQPLQHLPNASDIRKSTIQTYTDFQPRSKNSITLPTQRPFNPIENDGVWSSPLGTPNPQGGYSPTQLYFPPQTQNHTGGSITSASNSKLALSIPSATQLSRSSVVMINPVTEIPKLRAFKPAGSLTPTSGSPINQTAPQFVNMNQVGFGVGGSESDLIPGNRKSDVRRMMNTNF